MSAQLPARDQERLSAYLDKVLSLQERGTFEARLQTEPRLAQALSEMEHTRALLRRTPQRRAPRSFILRQSDIEVQPKAIFTGWTSLNLVSAAATFLLVLVFAGDVWANGLPLFGAAPAEEAFPQVMMEEAPTETVDGVGGGIPVTPTPSPEGEVQLFAAPEDASREVNKAAPFDLRLFLVETARPLELVLAMVAVGAALAAWWRRRKI